MSERAAFLALLERAYDHPEQRVCFASTSASARASRVVSDVPDRRTVVENRPNVDSWIAAASR